MSTYFQTRARDILRASLAELVNEPGLVKGVVNAQVYAAWLAFSKDVPAGAMEAARAGWDAAKSDVLSELWPKWFKSSTGDGLLFERSV